MRERKRDKDTNANISKKIRKEANFRLKPRAVLKDCGALKATQNYYRDKFRTKMTEACENKQKQEEEKNG